MSLAATLATRLIEAISLNPRIVLGLPTGRTPVALVSRDSFAQPARTRGLVAGAHLQPRRVRRPGRGRCRQLSLVHAGRVVRPRARSSRRTSACWTVAPPTWRPNARATSARSTTPGGIDIQILGIGANGHIGFNEPADALEAETHVAELCRPRRGPRTPDCSAATSTRVPSHALSMGMATILQAREIVLMATGAEKSDAVAADDRRADHDATAGVVSAGAFARHGHARPGAARRLA